MTRKPMLLVMTLCIAGLAVAGCGPKAGPPDSAAPEPESGGKQSQAPAPQPAEQEPQAPPPGAPPDPESESTAPEAPPAAKDKPLDIPKVSYSLGKQTADYVKRIGLDIDRDVVTHSWQDIVDGKAPAFTEEERKKFHEYLQKKAMEQRAGPDGAPSPDGESEPAPGQRAEASTAFGRQLGDYMVRAGVEIDRKMFTQGFQDVLDGNDLMLTEEELAEHGREFQKRAMASFREFKRQKAEENTAAAEAFLEDNAAKEGVVVLESGLQYKVLTQGAGKSPTATDRVKVHYRGRLLYGTEFDSSYKRSKPAEFAANRVMKGWTEALQLMKEGDKWELYIPPDLAYGLQGRPPHIGPGEMLIFEVELIEVLPPPPGPAQPSAPEQGSSESARSLSDFEKANTVICNYCVFCLDVLCSRHEYTIRIRGPQSAVVTAAGPA